MKPLSNQWHRPYINTILGAFLLTMTSLHLSAQVTLNTNKSGYYESITFEYTDTKASVAPGTTPPKVKKEFNIQENNPYNKLNYKTKGSRANGSKIYEIKKSEYVQLNSTRSSNSIDESNISTIEAKSHFFVKETENRAVVSYNLFLYDQYGEAIDNQRSSTIVVLDDHGVVSNTIENIPTDAFGTRITANGKYLTYFFGEVLEHSNTDIEHGLKIIRLSDNSLYYELKDVSTDGAFFSHNTLRINCFGKEEAFKLILDETDGSVYKMDNKSHRIPNGYLKFKDALTGQTVNQAELIKLK